MHYSHAMAFQIEHDRSGSRFVTHVDKRLCVADYRVDGRVMTMHHTYVPPALEGRGIAATLVGAALTHARDQGLLVRPTCSYVARYMQRHPETLDLLAR